MKGAFGYDFDEQTVSSFMKALLDIYDAAEAAHKVNAYDWIKDVKLNVVRAIVSVVSGEKTLASDSWANLVNILELFKERFKSANFAVWHITEGRAELKTFQYGGSFRKNVESYKQLFSKDTVHVWLSNKHYEFAVVKENINTDAFDSYTEDNSNVFQLLQQKKRRILDEDDSPDKTATNVQVRFKARPESMNENPTFQSQNTAQEISVSTPFQSQDTDSEFLTQNTPSVNESLDLNALLVQIRAGEKVKAVLNEQTMSKLPSRTNKELLSIIECIYTFDKKETFYKTRFRSKKDCVEEIQKCLI